MKGKLGYRVKKMDHDIAFKALKKVKSFCPSAVYGCRRWVTEKSSASLSLPHTNTIHIVIHKAFSGQNPIFEPP